MRIIILSRTHPCGQNLLVRDASPRDFSSLQTKFPRQGCIAPRFFIPAGKIFSSGMHHLGIFHPCRQNFLVRDASPWDFSSLRIESSHRDASPWDFSSLQTEFPRQGCIASGFFIPADRITSPGMHRHGIFHPCRQNLLGRDASTRDFSSLQTESLRQGCIAPGFFIPVGKIFSSEMHRPWIFHPCRQKL